MFTRFTVFFLTIIFYLCLRNNNRRSEYKIRISEKLIKIVFPFLNKRSRTEVDIVLFLEAVYLIIACIIYYLIIIFGTMSVEKATLVWVGMFFGTSSVMVGVELIRRSFIYNIAVTIIM